jgi:2-methylisocitrate lyase-like PEP mutase family enzyme
MRVFERAGVAGLMLEDQVWPKRCGHLKGKEVISAEEMAQKIRAAAEARGDPLTDVSPNCAPSPGYGAA